MSVDDKYTYPGSGGVLINAADIRDQATLDRAMNDVASIVMAAVQIEPVPDRPGFDYLQSIHTRMFRDLVPGIAGQIRDVDVQATGTGIPYCRPDYIDANLTTLFHKLEREDFLTDLDADTFSERLADRWGELSAIHPYRDGNTRSQSAYITALADRAGHPIDWHRIDVDTLRQHRLHAVAGNERPLATYLRDHLVPATQPATSTPTEGTPAAARRNADRRQAELLRAAGVSVERLLAAGTSPERLRAAGIEPGPDRTTGPRNTRQQPPPQTPDPQRHHREASRDTDGHER